MSLRGLNAAGHPLRGHRLLPPISFGFEVEQSSTKARVIYNVIINTLETTLGALLPRALVTLPVGEKETVGTKMKCGLMNTQWLREVFIFVVTHITSCQVVCKRTEAHGDLDTTHKSLEPLLGAGSRLSSEKPEPSAGCRSCDTSLAPSHSGLPERACQPPLVLIRTHRLPCHGPVGKCLTSHCPLGTSQPSPVCLPESSEGVHGFQKGGGKKPNLSVLALRTGMNMDFGNGAR